MNRQHFVFEKSITLNVTNETLKDREILVKWHLRNASAEILEEHGNGFCTCADPVYGLTKWKPKWTYLTVC